MSAIEHEWPCEHADGGAGACEDSNCPASDGRTLSAADWFAMADSYLSAARDAKRGGDVRHVPAYVATARFAVRVGRSRPLSVVTESGR